MIKFLLAAVWICVATLGAVFFAFQSSSTKEGETAAPAFFGGLDYVKTDIISVPLIERNEVSGYFLARFVYTVEPSVMRRLSVPAYSLLVDETYSYLFDNPQVDFSKVEAVDLDALRNGVRDGVNSRIGEKLIHDVLVEQVDYLSKQDIRDNPFRRPRDQQAAAAPAAGNGASH